MRSCGMGRGGFIKRVVADVAMADKTGALADDQATTAKIALQVSGLLEFDQALSGDITVKFAFDGDVSDLDFGLDGGLGGDDQVTGGGDGALEVTQDFGAFLESKLTFEFGVGTDDGGEFRIVHFFSPAKADFRILVQKRAPSRLTENHFQPFISAVKKTYPAAN